MKLFSNPTKFAETKNSDIKHTLTANYRRKLDKPPKYFTDWFNVNIKLAVMRHLSQRAAKDFLWATRTSFSIGLTTWTETLDRLVALRAMSQPQYPSAIFAERLLNLNDWPTETDWSVDDKTTDEHDRDSNSTHSQILPQGTLNPDGGSGEHPNWMYMVSSVSGLSNWEFHQYDDDPYPSVPHGHKHANHKWKLDVYQGWIYERTRQTGREPRWKITALWNDTRFRYFAIVALKYYIDHFPHRMDWRVGNPLRLPRRR